jgi:SSS family solute:Na+ symporter
VAWVSVLKDILMVFAVVAIGDWHPQYLLWRGSAPCSPRSRMRTPAHLTMPGATANLGHTWYISTVLLTCARLLSCGRISSDPTFTAKSSDTLRRNAVMMPLYTLTLAFILFAGFTAVLVVPGWPNGDLALLTVVRQEFSALVPGRGWRSRCAHRHGARFHFHSERLPPYSPRIYTTHLRACDDG